jgi:chemotaxis signal transduction protein
VLAIGAQASRGYREYRGTEGAAGRSVLALVCMPLGAADTGVAEDEVPAEEAMGAAAGGETIDVATFRVGTYLLGVPAAAVVEAIPFGGHVRLPQSAPALCGATIYAGATMPIYDLHAALGIESRRAREAMLTVVLRGPDGRHFGVLVDQLCGIPAVAVADIAPVSSVFVGITPVLASVVRAAAGPMLTLLAVEHMAAVLNAVKCDAVPHGLLE